MERLWRLAGENVQSSSGRRMRPRGPRENARLALFIPCGKLEYGFDLRCGCLLGPRPAPDRSAEILPGVAMPIVKFVKEKKEIEVPEGANLRSEALKAGIYVNQGFV